MKKQIEYFLLIFFILSIFHNLSAKDDWPDLKGPYLGQKPPGITPEIFAPGIISTGLDELSPAFSPDGKTFVFSVQMPGHVHHTILFTKMSNNQWQPLQVFPFSGKYSDADPAFSPDGSKLYFTSLRPGNVGGKKENNWDIWYVEKTRHGWSKPINPGPPINTEGLDTYPSLTHDGTLYFCSNRSGGYGKLDFYRSQYIDGRFEKPGNIGKPINTGFTEEGMISSTGKYLIFSSCNRPDSHGGCDLYISFYQGDKSWSKPINMGKKINSNVHDYCPHISPESKYIFFTSFRKIENLIWKNIHDYQDIVNIYNSPGNGNGDIYWVDAKIIEELKFENF
jgi:Tol biopolymer transport system component